MSQHFLSLQYQSVKSGQTKTKRIIFLKIRAMAPAYRKYNFEGAA